MLNYADLDEKSKAALVPEWVQSGDVDLPLFKELLTDTSELGTDSVLKDTKYNSLLKPFELEWSFGFDVSVPILNLTTDTRREIFFTTNFNGILYNYCTKEMIHLQGHQSKIISISVDRSGRWLVTADNSSEKMIMIWDTETYAIVWTIFNHPPKENDLLLVGLSPNARLLITVTNENTNTINFWLWTYGNDEPDDTYTDDRNLGAAKSIEFHPNKEDHFMIIFEKGIILFVWNTNTKKLAKAKSPKSPLTSSIGHYTDGTYVDNCHECFVSTSKGCILVFGNTIFAKDYVPTELDNDKFYIKSIKTQKGQLNCIVSADELIVTGDSNGTLMFFDKRIKLLYWFSRYITKPIKCVTFKMCPRRYEFVEENFQYDEGEFDCFIDRSTEYEKLVMEKVPKDATLENRPFISRDFFMTTVDGTIYCMNFIRQKFIPLFPPADSCVAAIDIHDELPYLLIAYAKGHLALYNYETHQEVMSSTLPETESDAVVTTIKYSSQCLHLACGRSNGELWLLQPAILAQIYVEPFKFGNDKIVKIAFSKSSLQMAYYDSNMTVFAFLFDTETEDWIFKGKVRSHYKEIMNILFLSEGPSALYTIGKDRHLIKYTDIAASEEELDILTRDRIEQKDVPIYFTPYPKGKFSKSGYFLVSDDKHKFKIISTKTTMCTAVYLAPAYGCFRDSPVRKTKFLPKSDTKYLLFMTKKHIGIQLMPIDGNPFKYVGCFAHPEEILDFQMSHDGKYVFTIGKNDRSALMWRVKTTSVETMHVLGGLELQPFYCLIEGGRGGFLYQEMRDLFYYMQILQHGEQICAPRIVTNSINLGELPDLMRACGYYPSEYEIENLLTDLRYKYFDDQGILKDKVTFCEFVKLFINHKPAYGYTIESLEEAFETITTFTDEYGGSDMPGEDFIEAITTTGEQVSTEQIYKCLARLLHSDMEQDEGVGERDFSFIPDSVDFDYFVEDILGIDMDTIEREAKEEDDEDDDNGRGYYYYRH